MSVPAPVPKSTEEKIALLKGYLTEGLTFQQIAPKLGWKYKSGVSKFAKKHGIDIKKYKDLFVLETNGNSAFSSQKGKSKSKRRGKKGSKSNKKGTLEVEIVDNINTKSNIDIDKINENFLTKEYLYLYNAPGISTFDRLKILSLVQQLLKEKKALKDTTKTDLFISPEDMVKLMGD